MDHLAGTWRLSQDLMAPTGYEALSMTEPSEVVHENGYHSLDDFIYDGGEWDDCRSGRRSHLDPAAAEPRSGDLADWDRDYSNAWDYAALADQARQRSCSTVSAGSSIATTSSSTPVSTRSSPSAKANETFEDPNTTTTTTTTTAAAAAATTTTTAASSTVPPALAPNRRNAGFWGFFGRARSQEPHVEPMRSAPS